MNEFTLLGIFMCQGRRMQDAGCRGSKITDSTFGGGIYPRGLIMRHFFCVLQRTKIWAKYSKDIETYVDKRAHLGE